MTTAVVAASLLPSALSGMPTAAVVGVLCAAVVAEIVVLPGVLPGAAITLLAGTLIAAGRPALAVAVPLTLAIAAGDQLAYFSGATVTGWWRRRRPGRVERRAGRAAVESWLTAAMPSLAAAAGLRYRQFAPRVLALRVPWLVAALGTGTLAAQPVARLGHAIGLAGYLVSGCVVAALLIFRWRARTGRRAPSQTGTLPPAPRRRARAGPAAAPRRAAGKAPPGIAPRTAPVPTSLILHSSPRAPSLAGVSHPIAADLPRNRRRASADDTPPGHLAGSRFPYRAANMVRVTGRPNVAVAVVALPPSRSRASGSRSRGLPGRPACPHGTRLYAVTSLRENASDAAAVAATM